ncbi:MAG: CapA family protein [Deltaproteobacteria bacterium]|nr:CapA family protein [Deltaproteobacteria bacterium]
MKHLACLVLAVAGCGGARGPAKVTHPVDLPIATPASTGDPQPTAVTGAGVLLVVTGYSGTRDDITLADLTRDYCSGKIGVLEEVRVAANARFGCTARPGLATLQAFLPTAKATKAALLVTDLAHVTNQFKAVKVDGVSFFETPATYPLVLVAQGDTPPNFAPHLTHFILTGVTAISRATGAAVDQHGIDWLTRNLRPHFTDAKYVHISNEVSLKDDCTYPVSGTYSFCTKERDYQALVDLRANVIELTGNHTRDFGDEPFKKSLEWYKAHGMATFGGGLTPTAANEPVILALADGKQLGIIGFNEKCPLKECAVKTFEVGANAYDAAKARAAIARMRRELGADFVMVTVQFKEWDNAKPTESQAAISRQLIEDGADMVYGSQAHQLQVMEFYKGKPIFHGLGNFLFDQIHRIGVRQAYFVHNYFFEGRLVQSVPVFTFMSDERQPTLATPAQAAEMKALIYQDALLYE